jgi:peptide/nickel transport system ATP-binding protein
MPGGSSTAHGQPRERDIDGIPDSPPDLRRLLPRCSFTRRCPRCTVKYRRTLPNPRFLEPGHIAACFAVASAVGLPA